jgi:hypothetical protein
VSRESLRRKHDVINYFPLSELAYVCMFSDIPDGGADRILAESEHDYDSDDSVSRGARAGANVARTRAHAYARACQ